MPDMTGGQNPVRSVVERAAMGEWSRTDAKHMVESYGEQSLIWKDWVNNPDYLAPLVDALARGGPTGGGVAIIGGGGTGPEAEVVKEAGYSPVVVDISAGMLTRCDAGQRVLTDMASASIRDGSVDMIVLLNAPIFAIEVERLLRPGGWLVWCSSFGSHTPIYLSPFSVVESLGDTSVIPALGALAGHGEWLTFRKR